MSSSLLSVDKAIVALQSSSTPINLRLNALRYLKNYLTEGSSNQVLRSQINRLILDNILSIIMGKEINVDILQSQYIRAECFLILSQILDTPVLFDDAKRKIGELPLSQNESEIQNEDDLVSKRETQSQINMHKNAKFLPKSSIESTTSVVSGLSSLDSMSIGTSVSNSFNEGKAAGNENENENDRSKKLFHTMQPPGGWVRKSNIEKKNRKFSSSADTLNIKDLVKEKLKPKYDRLAIKKAMFRPRASVMYGSEYEMQNILPGERNSTNWIEQDKKLGYQKSRMWFPTPNLLSEAKMLPDNRNLTSNRSDQVVEEFLKMKALLSYVGDIVNAPSSKVNKQTPHGSGSGSGAGAGKLDTNTYTTAVKEITNYWKPLIGASLPAWAKTPTTQQQSLRTLGEDGKYHFDFGNSPYCEIIKLPGAAGSPGKSSQNNNDNKFKSLHKIEKNVIWTKNVLRKLLKKELVSQYKSKKSLKDTLHLLVSSSNNSSSSSSSSSSNLQLTSAKIHKIQTDMALSIQNQQSDNDSSIQSIRTLMLETIKLQYASLPPRYVLVLEKRDKNPRNLIQRMLDLYLRVKINGYLSTALGVWKICLIKAELDKSRPKYSKIAGAQLMLLWFKNKVLKRKRFWVNRWKKNVTEEIFKERVTAVVILQKLYRMWRDKRYLMRLHLVAPYNGPLSDIYLGEYRPNIRFKINREIRQSRRMFWLATTVVQSRYRGLLARRWYWEKLSILILLQSVCRMYPKRCYYKRLKKTTIKCQAWSRRTVKKIQFLRLKRCTIVVQKYVRRMLGISQKWRLFHADWRSLETKMGLSVFIQTRWRERKAKIKLVKIRKQHQSKQQAALRLQALWYKHKGAFHTFLLMCCYRSIDEIEKNLATLGKSLGRGFAARLVQRYYKHRYYDRLVAAAGCIQRWYRGAKGYNYVMLLRRKKWAARKLHHWARAMMKYKHKCARMIQKCWWDFHAGSFIKHIHKKYFDMDRANDQMRRDRKYNAAARIQAILKGIQTRVWLKYDRAIRTIQRPLRFYLFRQRCKREARERNRRAVVKIVGNIIGRALLARSIALAKYQNKIIVKPQALVRKFLVRSVMYKAKKYAFKYGLAVVCIQRFWRRSGAMIKAVQELMVIRRLQSNPFAAYERVHELVRYLRKVTDPLYTTRDSRSGLRIYSLLQRLGLAEYAPMFPKKDYSLATQLRGLTVEGVAKLYEKWQDRIKKERKKKGAEDSGGGGSAVNKRIKVPTSVFETIVNISSPPVVQPKNEASRKVSNALKSVTEVYSPDTLSITLTQLFSKKFGKNLHARSKNFCSKVIEMAFGKYNNYRSVHQVLSLSLIERALEISSNPGDVIPNIETLLKVSPLNDDVSWDNLRITKAADYLEFAAEKLMSFLPQGTLRSMIEAKLVRISLYKRKFLFVLNHIKQLAREAKQAEVKAMNDLKKGIKPDKSKPTTKDPKKSTETNNLSPQEKEDKLIVSDRANKLSIEESIELEFTLDAEPYLELEMKISICKILYDLFDQIELVSNCIQTIKNKWSMKLVANMIRKAQLDKFLSEQSRKYLDERKVDRVRVIWEKFRKIEAANKELDRILYGAAVHRLSIEETLKGITRYGWTEALDTEGYSYWYSLNPMNEAVYEMPLYTFEEYLAATKLQGRIRKTLYRLHERKRLKEEAKLKDMQAAEEAWGRDMAAGKRLVTFNLRYSKRYTLRGIGSREDAARQNQTPKGTFKESLLPYNMRFVEKPTWKTGDWGLLRSEDETFYEVVTVFQLKNDGLMCDVRNTKGKKYNGVKTSRVFRNNFDIGSRIEARYKSMKYFYSGVITAIHDKLDEKIYTILYDDGEKERNVNRSMIRLSTEGLEQFVSNRNKYLVQLDKQLLRVAHYANMKSDRLVKSSKIRDDYIKEFAKCWAEANGVIFNPTPPPTPPVTVKPDSADPSKSKPSSSGSNKPKSPGSPTRPSRNNNAKQPPAKPQNMQSIPGMHIINMLNLSKSFINSVCETSCDVKFTRRALRFGWKIIIENNKEIYYEESTGEKTRIPPVYTPLENFGAKKFQSLYQLYKSKKNFKKLLSQESIPYIIDNCLTKYQTQSYIGYRLEGLTIPQILCRAGHWDVAKLIEKTFADRPNQFKNITVPYIVNLSKANYISIGLTESDEHVSIIKSLVDFQRWYKRSTPAQMEASLTLFNYYKTPYDTRNIKECVLESEDYVYKKLVKAMPNNATRAKTIAKSIVTSGFPHGRRQLDAFISKYSEKVGVMQDNVNELIDKSTTHTWMEERNAYKTLRRASRRIVTILGNLHLKGLRNTIASIEKKADDILLLEGVETDQRPLTSGPEAKAALLIRTEIMAYLLECIKSSVKLQAFLRSNIRRILYTRLITKRRWAYRLLQRTGRGYNARKLSYLYKLQQKSVWEQLWDTKRNLLYYYHKKQRFSTYEEPAAPYRPLVRDLRSDALIQAWPHIELTDKSKSIPPTAAPGTFIPPPKCQVCNTRKTIRVCLDCTYPIPKDSEKFYDENARELPTSYCFPCYTKVHSEEPVMLTHKYHDLTVTDEQRQHLICSECKDKPATRKCLGILDDRQIDEVCTELQRRRSSDWNEVLHKTNVAGERKLALMIGHLMAANKLEYLKPSQLQQVRTMLEQTRAECDECYCDECYKEMHAAGKRVLHKWLGFNEYADPCAVCFRSPSEVSCQQCESIFCKPCFKVFHTKGRKRKHHYEIIMETSSSPENETSYCSLCTRRISTHDCANECSFFGCNSCYECIHKPECDISHSLIPGEEKPYFECVVCGERADQQCIQCSDYFCSTTWMGNPGCFAKMHKKGNRAQHTTCEIDPSLEAAKLVSYNQKKQQSPNNQQQNKISKSNNFRNKSQI